MAHWRRPTQSLEFSETTELRLVSLRLTQHLTQETNMSSSALGGHCELPLVDYAELPSVWLPGSTLKPSSPHEA